MFVPEAALDFPPDPVELAVEPEPDAGAWAADRAAAGDPQPLDWAQAATLRSKARADADKMSFTRAASLMLCTPATAFLGGTMVRYDGANGANCVDSGRKGAYLADTLVT